jgi:hypothetical protein
LRSSTQKGDVKVPFTVWEEEETAYAPKSNAPVLPMQVSPGLIVTVTVVSVLHDVPPPRHPVLAKTETPKSIINHEIVMANNCLLNFMFYYFRIKKIKDALL